MDASVQIIAVYNCLLPQDTDLRLVHVNLISWIHGIEMIYLEKVQRHIFMHALLLLKITNFFISPVTARV